MNLFYQPEISKGIFFLDEEELHHAKVLRLKTGDVIALTDGLGFFYRATITQIDSKKCGFEITEKKSVPKKEFSIHIAIAPTKNIDRMEWFVEKTTEIGIDKISFMVCEKSERKNVNLDRLKKIAISAMKQSQRAWLPAVSGMTKFSDLLTESADQKWIAHVDAQHQIHLAKVAQPRKNYVVLIGPEGDFSDTELTSALHHSFQKISLGENRLRTETAGFVACSILNYIQ